MSMQVSKEDREFILHKVKHDFITRESTLHGYETDAEQAAINGRISSDRFFLELLGMKDEFKKLEEYYNPNNYKLVYDPEIVGWRYVHKQEEN
ncbi:hypothetical protein [Limosilactobacillus balticus]|uniref:hypothetical protein n=1 Tax=Limosilactobacillus balticus TaxID=2759747 RepID=UPI001E2CE257|nr:hypothetical protein [Limosilactobacillus balticus]MCD7132985.1 hypothetical protein [Limosilactobacillus balticus]